MKGLLDIARSYVGTKEGPGGKNNPTIVQWIQAFGLNLKSKFALSNDSTAWCAIFVSKVLAEGGYTGTNHALAVKYATWGRPSKPVPGCVVVIKRKREGADKRTGSRAGFHVGFLVEVNRNFYKLCGGNQKNSVCVASYSRKHYKLIAFRCPAVVG